MNMYIHTCIYIYICTYPSLHNINIYICIHCICVEYYLYSTPGVFFSTSICEIWNHQPLAAAFTTTSSVSEDDVSLQRVSDLETGENRENLHDSPGMSDGGTVDEMELYRAVSNRNMQKSHLFFSGLLRQRWHSHPHPSITLLILF